MAVSIPSSWSTAQAPIRTSTASFFCLALLAILASPGICVAGDPVVYRIEGTNSAQHLGVSISALGDLDGDGVPDFAAARELFITGNNTPGQINLYSGKDGRLIQAIPGTGPIDDLGKYGLGVIPDLDRDGIPEIFAMLRSTGFVVLSATTGREWYRVAKYIQNGVPGGPTTPLEWIEDLDGDGIEEFAGASFFSNPPVSPSFRGVVTVFSSRTGEVLWERFGDDPMSELGFGLLRVADFNGDGVTDLLASERLPLKPEPFPGETLSRLIVLSGRDGQTLRAYEPPTEHHFGFGTQLASLGDRDGDHYPEVAVAAPLYSEIEPFVDAGGRATQDGRQRGWVGVYRLPTWELLYSHEGVDVRFVAFHGDMLGYRLCAPGDLDGDGVTDLLMGTNRHSNNNPDRFTRLHLVSGMSGRILNTYESVRGSDLSFIEQLAPLGDVDGDQTPEFLASDALAHVYGPHGNTELAGAGRILLLRFEASGPVFLRGDANDDGRVNLSDAVTILHRALKGPLCEGDPELDVEGPICPAAFDVNADGCIQVRDVVELARFLFRSYFDEAAPVPPYPACGRLNRFHGSGLYGTLGCREHASCAER